MTRRRPDDSDETEGRALYRAIADRDARAEMAMAARRVKYPRPVEHPWYRHPDGETWWYINGRWAPVRQLNDDERALLQETNSA